MKQYELRNIIREEIKRVLNEKLNIANITGAVHKIGKKVGKRGEYVYNGDNDFMLSMGLRTTPDYPKQFIGLTIHYKDDVDQQLTKIGLPKLSQLMKDFKLTAKLSHTGGATTVVLKLS